MATESSNQEQIRNELKQIILRLCEQRGTDSTICPSEAARKYTDEDWRELMGTVRSAASELKQEGRIEILQNGERVDIDSVSGPIRLGIHNNDSDD